MSAHDSSNDAILQSQVQDHHPHADPGTSSNPLYEQPSTPATQLPTALASKGTKRGRKAQDPRQTIVHRECTSQHELEQQLSEFLHDESHDRQHTLFEASLPLGAAFLVDYGPAAAGAAKSNSYKYGPAFAPGVGPVKEGHVARSMSVWEALQPNSEDPKERMRKQRAVSRSVENAVEQVDGHRYAFHNEWLARDNDAYRFSYFCNDSLLNKDRTLGGVKKNDEGKVKRARKQVYDCQGYLTVKFSATKENLEVLYKHIPVHPTYDERAPVPRVGTKRFEILQKNDPNHELIQRAQEREARKRMLATKTASKPARRKSSRPDLSDPETPTTQSTRRRTSQEGEEVQPDSSTGFRFRNLTVDTHPSAKKARTQSARDDATFASTPPLSGNRTDDELARVKAELEAAQQVIRDLQSPIQSSTTGAPSGLQYDESSSSSTYPTIPSTHAIPQSPYDQQSPYSHRPHPQPNQGQRTDAESIAAAASASASTSAQQQAPPSPHGTLQSYPPPNSQQHPHYPYFSHSPFSQQQLPPGQQPPPPLRPPKSTNSRRGGGGVQFHHYQPTASPNSNLSPELNAPPPAAVNADGRPPVAFSSISNSGDRDGDGGGVNNNHGSQADRDTITKVTRRQKKKESAPKVGTQDQDEDHNQNQGQGASGDGKELEGQGDQKEAAALPGAPEPPGDPSRALLAGDDNSSSSAVPPSAPASGSGSGSGSSKQPNADADADAGKQGTD